MRDRYDPKNKALDFDKADGLWASLIGKRVSAASLGNDALSISFDDGTRVEIWDAGQSCCESRCMVCDDDLSTLVGGTLIQGAFKDGPDTQGEYGECHEVQFMEITTSTGWATVSNHNEHNGYYGGFDAYIRVVE